MIIGSVLGCDGVVTRVLVFIFEVGGAGCLVVVVLKFKSNIFRDFLKLFRFSEVRAGIFSEVDVRFGILVSSIWRGEICRGGIS